MPCLRHFLFDGIDQLNRGEEANLAAAVFDGLVAEGGRDMGLAGARTADQHDVLRAFDQLAAVQSSDGGLIDLAGGEIKACEALVGWEACGFVRLAMERTSRSASSAFIIYDRIGVAASNAGSPCSIGSVSASTRRG